MELLWTTFQKLSHTTEDFVSDHVIPSIQSRHMEDYRGKPCTTQRSTDQRYLKLMWSSMGTLFQKPFNSETLTMPNDSLLPNVGLWRKFTTSASQTAKSGGSFTTTTSEMLFQPWKLKIRGTAQW